MTSFSDDFNRADGSPGANWVQVSGTWTIVSNQLSPGAAGGTIVLRAAGAMASNDNFAQVTIAATTVASQGVWCRGNAGITQGFLWRNNGTSWDLFQVIGGSFTSIGTYAAAAVAGDVAKVQAVGSTITGYVNGVARVSVVNTNVTTGTSVGIRSDSAGALRYDDFSAADVTEGATLGIASGVETAQPLTGAKALTLGIAAESDGAQQLTGAKAATLGLAGAVDSAQPVTGTKAVPLGPAVATDTAQPSAGTKASALTIAAAPESAQALVGTKAATLGPAVTPEAAQPLLGSKTAALGTSLEVAAGQTLAGAKAATLPIAAEADSAQPVAGSKIQTLGIAAAEEAAQQLVGTKTAVLGLALETATARPLVAGAPNQDIDFTVRAAPDRWVAREPYQPRWSAGAPDPRWTAREPDA